MSRDNDNERGLATFVARHPVGDEVDGVVTSIVSFGAFIQVDGVDGLLHVSEWGERPVLGQAIRVRIAAVDLDQHRLSFTLAWPEVEYIAAVSAGRRT